MEYMQMTLNDWLEMKQSLERELSNLKTGFIRVGYCLRRIEDSRGYEQDGYKSIAEFAKAEYGLSASTVSRFMAINERFSLDGYSERLDPKYMGFHQSIMGEMLGLPDNDLELVTPETSRQDVRELKQFNRTEPEEGVADDLQSLIESYFRENREELNELYNGRGTPAQEILNPSGNKVYRKGMYMLFFYTDCVKTKKFGGKTSSYSWEEFRFLIDGVFADSAGPDTYANYFGTSQESPKTPQGYKEETMPALERPAVKEMPSAEGRQIRPAPYERTNSEGVSAEDVAVEGRQKKQEQEIVPPAEGALKNNAAAEGESNVAPAQIPPVSGQGGVHDAPGEEPEVNREYAKAVEDAGSKLEEIRQNYEMENWTKMSEQLLSLGFVVNQLKVMKKIQT